MRNVSILSLLCLCMFAGIKVQAQTCGFDYKRHLVEKQFPAIKEAQLQLDEQIRQQGVQRYLRGLGIDASDLRSGGAYAGTIYEIPVVVHVIESSADSLKHLKLTDDQIRTWIENCNKMYATTYGNGYYAEGDGIHGGAIIPFRLVLAKRTPTCQPTTGIIRYNGSSLPGYDHGGVKYSNTYSDSCITLDQMRQLAPHWTDGSYYNIYIVTGFDGDKKEWGLMGWAHYPNVPWSIYETVMRATVVTNLHDSTLAHEFGHALGLMHPFEGTTVIPDSDEAGVKASDCPVNNDCTKDNDQVCDTEPTANLLNIWNIPTDTTTNPCTGMPYEGVQFNIMNYTNAKRKFTVGQRERALAQFLTQKGALINSLGAIEPDAASVIDLSMVPARCRPQSLKNEGYSVAMSHIKLNALDRMVEDGASATNFYKDCTLDNCLVKGYTDISATEQSTLTLTTSIHNTGHYLVWIDYNNDGAFSSTTEKIYDKWSATKGEVLNITFTPPANAVKDKYLRMRVKSDFGSSILPCDMLLYGRVEDYAVRIAEGYSSIEGNNPVASEVVVFDKNTNNILLLNAVDTSFGHYEVYDLQGRLLLKGTSPTSRISLNTTLPAGAFLVKYRGKTVKVNN